MLYTQSSVRSLFFFLLSLFSPISEQRELIRVTKSIQDLRHQNETLQNRIRVRKSQISNSVWALWSALNERLNRLRIEQEKLCAKIGTIKLVSSSMFLLYRTLLPPPPPFTVILKPNGNIDSSIYFFLFILSVLYLFWFLLYCHLFTGYHENYNYTLVSKRFSQSHVSEIFRRTNKVFCNANLVTASEFHDS